MEKLLLLIDSKKSSFNQYFLCVFFRVFIFAKYKFVDIRRLFIFANGVSEKTSCVTDFAKIAPNSCSSQKYVNAKMSTLKVFRTLVTPNMRGKD